MDRVTEKNQKNAHSTKLRGRVSQMLIESLLK